MKMSLEFFYVDDSTKYFKQFRSILFCRGLRKKAFECKEATIT